MKFINLFRNNKRIIFSDVLINVSIVLYSLFAFSRNSVGEAIPFSIWVIIIIIALFLLIVGSLFKREIRISSIVPFLFYILFVALIYNNLDFENGIFMNYVVIAIPIVFCILLSKRNCWFKTFRMVLIIVSIFYSFWTIVCAVNPNIYDAFVLPFLRRFIPNASRGSFTCGITTHYSTNGMYIVPGVIVLGSSFLTNYRQKKNLSFANILLFVFCLVGLLLSGKRGILISFLISFVICFLFVDDNKKTPFVVIAFLGSAFLLFVIALSVFPELGIIIERFQIQSSREDVFTGRLDIWNEAINDFYESPFFGHGWAWFKYNNSFGLEFHTHNCYIQWLCELGLLFSAPLFIFVFYSLVFSFSLYLSGRKKRRFDDKKTLDIISSFMFILYFSAFMFEGTGFYETQGIFPYLMFVIMSFYHNRQSLARGETRSFNQIVC